MTRTNRIATLLALALLVAAAGTVLAVSRPRSPEQPALFASSHEAEPETEETEVEDEEEGDPVAHALERLGAAGIPTDDNFAAVAEQYGVGGAVRLYAWADATGMTVDEIVDLRDGDGEGPPVGWGVLAKELEVHPGIGSIMGRGHGPDGPPGLQNKPDRGADD